MSIAFLPETSKPLRASCVAGKARSSIWPIGFAGTAAAPRKWFRRLFCEPLTRLDSGAGKPCSPPGFSHSPHGSTVRSCGASQSTPYRWTTSRNQERTDAGLEEEETARTLRRALDALPPKYREPLLLYYFHELDVTAAAKNLGLPEGTLKARLSRGRDLLRAKLAQVAPVWQRKEA